jgi:NTE family protein
MGLFDVLSRASSLAQVRIATERLHAHPPDCLITVSLPDIGLFDFHRTTEAVKAGRMAARQALPAIHATLAAASSWSGRVSRWSAPRIASR